MDYSITQNGKPLDKSKYTIDEEAKTFSTTENNLVLDFRGLGGWTFKTGSDCTFKTGSSCTFNTGWDCTFDTGSHCTFDTDWDCTFKTGSHCTFNTGWDCTFKDIEERCVVVRRDEFEVIELPVGKTIKLNEYGVLGYEVIEE